MKTFTVGAFSVRLAGLSAASLRATPIYTVGEPQRFAHGYKRPGANSTELQFTYDRTRFIQQNGDDRPPRKEDSDRPNP